jgi:outer membrane protein
LIVKRRAIFWLYATLLAGSASLAHAEIKIGVVDIQRLAAESPQAKAANDALQTEFSARYQELLKQEEALQARQDRLTKDAPTMTELQRSAADKELRDGVRDLQTRRSAFQDDLDARKQDENNKISRVLQEEVAAYAKAQSFDLILADGVLFATGALDVTNAILQSLHKTGAAAPAAAPAAAGAPAKNAAPASIAKP